MNTQNLPYKDGDQVVIPLPERTFKSFLRTGQFSLDDGSFAAALGIFLDEVLSWDIERFEGLGIPRVGLILYGGHNGGGTSNSSAVFMPSIYQVSEQRSLVRLHMGPFVASMSHAVQQTADLCNGDTDGSKVLRDKFLDFKFRVQKVQRTQSKTAP